MKKSTPKGNNPIPWFVIKATSIASLGGILFGYDLGVISSALQQISNEFDLDQSQKQRIVSVLYLGGSLGAIIGGPLCDFLGRKATILLTDVWFFTGAIVLASASSVTALILGRITVGFAVAVSGVADVSYLHEISPSEWRGSIVSVNEACISLGFLLAYTIGYVVDNADPQSGWRTMFGLSGAVAVIQFIGMLQMPESPVWLKEKARKMAKESVQNMYGASHCGTPHHISADMTNTKINLGSMSINRTSSLTGRSMSSEKLPEKSHRERNYFACDSVALPSKLNKESPESPLGWSQESDTKIRFYVKRRSKRLQITSVSLTTKVVNCYYGIIFCGQTPVLNYAPLIFESIGMKTSSLGPSILIGIVKFSVTVLVILRIEYIGRRRLLLLGISIIAFGLLLLAVAFRTSQEEGNEGEPEESPSSTFDYYLSLIGVIFVVMGYSASFGPLTWLLTSELAPTNIRGRILGASTIVTYLCASLITSVFLSAQQAFGLSIVFCAHGIITVVGLGFACLAIPDTGGKSVKEIEGELRQMWLWRDDTNDAIVHEVAATEIESAMSYMRHPLPAEVELT